MLLCRITYLIAVYTICFGTVHASEVHNKQVRRPSAYVRPHAAADPLPVISEDDEPGSLAWLTAHQPIPQVTDQINRRKAAPPQNIDDGFAEVDLEGGEDRKEAKKTTPSKRAIGSSCMSCAQCPHPRPAAVVQEPGAAPAAPSFLSFIWAWCTGRHR